MFLSRTARQDRNLLVRGDSLAASMSDTSLPASADPRITTHYGASIRESRARTG